MTEINKEELNRQFRVLKQTIGIHSDLAHVYKRRSLILDVVILVSSTLLCATVFVDDTFLRKMGIDVSTQLIVGFFSLAVFICSIFSIQVGWKELSARHFDATQKLTKIMALFRRYRNEDGTWPVEVGNDINNRYWEVYENIIEIPADKFVIFKARYLRKMELSRLSSEFPGCPLCLLRCYLIFCFIKKCLFNRDDIKEPLEGESKNDMLDESKKVS